MSLDLLHRRRKHLLIAAAAALSFYSAYKLYRSRTRKKLGNLLKTLTSVADALSSSIDTASLLSTDINIFIRSDSDEIPNSLKQLSKLARSPELSCTVSRVSEALTVGVVKGIGSGSGSGHGLGFTDKILDKLFSDTGSGFVSMIAGSFAKNLVLGFYTSNDRMSEDDDNPSSKWIDLIYDCKCRALIAECIQVFVSSAVEVFLDKTMDVNTYDLFFSGLTNPSHDVKVKDLLVSVCNGVVETLIKTSHQVMTASNQERQPLSQNVPSDERIREIGKWVNRASSTLSVPRNRRLVLDVTGRVTFETVKSFLEFVLLKVYDGVKRGAGVIHEEVFERGFELVRYVGARSMLIATICFAICMHVMTVGVKGLDTSMKQHLVLPQ